MRAAGLRTHIFLLATICPVWVVSASAQQPPQRADDVVRVSTELVQTDFMVFDKQGNFVNGLKRDQFALKVDGKPRGISFFDRIAAGSSNEEAQLAAARGTPVPGTKATPLPLDRGRIVMFFLDDLHLSPSSIVQARALLKRFIEREMGQNDLVEIASTSGQLGFLQQLTDNKAVLNAAVERLHVRQLTASGRTEYPPMSEYHALLIEQHDSDLLDYFIDALLRENPNLPRQTAATMVTSRASGLLKEASSITTRTMNTFRRWIDQTTTIPGRKLVYFISDGFFLDHNNSDSLSILQRTVSSAARSSTVIYSIDARGLTSGLPDAATLMPVDISGVLMRAAMGEMRASQDVMNALAVDTGGRAFFNSNDLSAAVTTGLKETSVYYLLAWRPETDEQRSPKYRRIDVNIIGRADLVVRFRKGFGAPAPDENAQANDRPSSEAPKSPTDQINEVLRAPFPQSDLPVAISLNFLDTAQYGATVTASIKVATRTLQLELQNGTPTATLDLAGGVFNDQGKSVSTFNKRLTIRAKSSDAAATKPPEQVFYNHFAVVKPGIYQVRVAALDVKQGKTGSAYGWIEIPDLQLKALTLSSLIVGEKKSDADLEAADSTNPNEPQRPAPLSQVILNVDHRFASSSSLRFLTIIYNAALAPATAPPAGNPSIVPPIPGTAPSGVADLAAQVQVFRDDQPVITAPIHKIETTGAQDAQRVPYAADVRLDSLKPGAYVLQVTIIDRLAKTSASQKFSFHVE